MHANISAHTGRQLKRKRRQVTYLLLLWVQPCVYFYSFHMHSPSSPFILSSLLREETHQLMFSFTVIGWFKAASVNCAPPPSQSPHCSSSTLCYSLPVPYLFCLLWLSLLFSFKTGNVTCECVGRMILWTRGCCVTVPCLDEFCMRDLKKKYLRIKIISQHIWRHKSMCGQEKQTSCP